MRHISFIKTPCFMKKQSPFQNYNFLLSAFFKISILFVPKNEPFSLLQENELTDLGKIFTENCWQSAVQVNTILFALDKVLKVL